MVRHVNIRTLTAVCICTVLICYKANAEMTMTIGSTIQTLMGTDILLKCEIKNAPADAEVFWISPSATTYEVKHLNGRFGSGHRRYELKPSGDHYDFQITNVQPIDDGTYSCGIYPTETTQRVIKDLRVNVYVQPSPPVISGVGDVYVEPTSVGNAVEIVTIRQGTTSAQVKCTVGPSKPVVPIRWLAGGRELGSTFYTSESTTNDSTNLDTMTSVLTINPVLKNMNGAQYKCMADMSKISVSGETLSPLYKTFNLSVHFAPGPPTIKGFQDSFRQPGDMVTLTCETAGGNPLPTLQWYRNGQPHNHEFKTVEELRTVKSELIVPIAATDNNAVYRCDSKNAALAQPQTVSVKFRVHFAPAKVVIVGGEQVKAGKTLALSCTTTNSNPRAVIIWRGNNGRAVLTTNDADTTVTDSTEGGYITQTNITVIANRTDHGAEFTCEARNDMFNKVVSSSVTLDVLYPPDELSVSGFDASQAVLVGTVRKMTCTSTGGNPLPDLTWYSGSTAISADVGPLRTRGKMRTRELSIIARPEDNDVIYMCSASSAATPKPVKRASFNISVYFPPQNVTISPQRPMKEGVRITLTCDSGSSHPESVITWKKNDSAVQDTKLIKIIDGLFGGKVTVSSYTFTPQASDNGLVVLCEAKNNHIGRSTTQGMVLNILHKPRFSAAPTVLRLQEGKNLTNNDFSAKANPTAIAYTWFKVVNGVETKLTLATKRDSTKAKLTATNGIFNIIKAHRNYAGAYRVKATNSEGITTADFTIDIQYGAGISQAPTQSYVGGSLKLNCIVAANPPITLNRARWTRLNYDMSRSTQTVSGTGSSRTLTITIRNVVRVDIGKFTCEANNTFGTVTREYTVKPVAFAPVIDRAPSTSKAAAQTHNDGLIKCNLDAFPVPNVTWSKDGTAISLPSDKYSMSVKKEGQIKFSFELTVKKIRQSDYGKYDCIATNGKGSDRHSILLNGTSKPDPPSLIVVFNETDDSVTLGWEPGFDGGLKQTFNIRYNIRGGTAFMYADATKSHFTLGGLQPETEYEFTVLAFNELGRSAYHNKTVGARTMIAPTAKSLIVKPDEPMFIIIMALAVVGGLLLIVLTVLLCVFVRRRRRRKQSEATDSASQSNTVEMYGTHDGSYFHDDAKSYSTCEKGYDEDDYVKHYEADNEVNHARSGTDNGTYISPEAMSHDVMPPWAKTEDPGGHSGAYFRRQPSVGSRTTHDEHYADALRGVDRELHQPNLVYGQIERPAFVAGRPAPPPPPGRIPNRSVYGFGLAPPSVPERNYSPLEDIHNPGGIYHATYEKSSSSVASTDDMAGHLV